MSRTLFLCLIALLFTGCSVDLQVDDQTYHCATDGDCGEGFRCVQGPGANVRVCIPSGQDPLDMSMTDASSSGGDSVGGDTSTTPDGGDAIPTTPVVSILPAAPTTLDELQVSVDTESTLEGGGAVSYQYRWTFNDAEVATTATLSAQETAKKQSWTVEVTPVADGTGEMGTPATATVVILNSAPVLHSAQLSRYEAWGGDSIEVLPGRTTDADEDATGIRVRWMRNDVELTAPEFQLTEIDLSLITDWVEGDTLTVVINARDAGPENDLSEDITIGPIAIHPDRTHWERLTPPLGSIYDFAFAPFVYDEKRERLLYFIAGQLWEYGLGQETPRWTELRPTQAGAAEGVRSPRVYNLGAPVLDEANDRMIIVALEGEFSGASTISLGVYSLSLAAQGAEEWTRLEVLGTPPEPRLYVSNFHDIDNQRLILWGGYNMMLDEPFADPMWSLDLSTPGGETWEQLTPTDAPLGSYSFPGLAIDPTSNKAVLFGGIQNLNEGDMPDPSAAAFMIDMTPGAETFTAFGDTLPGGVVGDSVVFDEAGTGYVLSYNGLGLDYTLSTFNTTEELFTTAPLIGDAPPASILSGLLYAPNLGEQGSLLVVNYGGGDDSATPWGLYRIDLGLMEWSPLQVPGVNFPAGRRESVLGLLDDDTSSFVTFSGDVRGTPKADAWTFNAEDRTWAELVIEPDPTHGVPVARYDHNITVPPYNADHFTIYGGYEDSSQSSGRLSDVWRAVKSGDTWQWLRQDNPADLNLPPGALMGATMWESSCGGGDLTAFGGYSPMGGSGDSVWQLRNCGSGVNCAWTEMMVSGASTKPLPRQRAASIKMRSSSDTWIYGGELNSGGNDDVTLWSTNDCQAPSNWSWMKNENRGLQVPSGFTRPTMSTQRDLNNVLYVIDTYEQDDNSTGLPLWRFALSTSLNTHSARPMTIHDERMSGGFYGVATTSLDGDFYLFGGSQQNVSTTSQVLRLHIVDEP